jgi:hypothetical protein
LAALALACEQIIGADFGVNRVDCKHVQPPPPPAPLPGGDLEILEGVHGVDFGESDGGYQMLGFDGDQTCTLLGQGPTCALAKWVDAGPVRDGIDGRDNAIGALTSSQNQAFGSAPFQSSKLSDEIDKGINPAAAIFRVRGYNGFTNDSDIDVEWYLAANPVPDAGAPNWGSTPTLDITSDSADPGDGGAPLAKWHSTKAYVSGYQLVAEFENTIFRVATVPFPMFKAVLTADLGRVVGRLANAQLWGIVRMNLMFDLLPEFTRYVAKATVCKSSGLYPIVKGFFCQFPDIRLDGTKDPTTPCDGLTFAVAIDTRPVRIGAVVVEARPSPCMPGDDPKGDSCDNPP